MSYQINLSDNSYCIIKLILESRLAVMKQNISAYVERVIEYEEILKELDQAIHVSDPKPPREQSKKKTKVVAHNLCSDHPSYGGKNRPTRECETCWRAYEKLNGRDAAIRAKRDFNRKQKLGKAAKPI